MIRKPAISFRLSEEAQRLLEAMAEKSAISKTAVLELAIREKARRDGIEAA